jgi:protein-S-isoprenylcysteine O-methyltransferase Ste14
MEKTTTTSFTQRGGWWVLAQVPVLMLAVALPWWTANGPFDAREFPRLVGAMLTVLGFLLTLTGLFSLGASLTPFPRPLERGVLRRHGVYAFMRHPVYTGLIFASLGWTLCWASIAGLASAALTLVFFDRKAAREERWLRQHYPDYDDYALRVKKFLPGIY